MWPRAFSGLVAFGEFILTLGPVGVGLHGFLDRLLIPLDLHHALDSVFWSDVAGINDLGTFLDGTGTYGVTDQYMTGSFPIMMFGLPGAALAMYVTAKSSRCEVPARVLFSNAVVAFAVGITEPLEFSFTVLARFTRISMALSAALPERIQRVHRPCPGLGEPDGAEPLGDPAHGHRLVHQLLPRLPRDHPRARPGDPRP